MGVSGDPLLQRKQHPDVLEPFDVRFNNVIDLLRMINPSVELNVFLLNDPYGPTISDSRIDVLVLSKETESALSIINQKREASSIPVIGAIVVDYLLDPSRIPNYLQLLKEGKIDSSEFADMRISSTFIRSKIHSRY